LGDQQMMQLDQRCLRHAWDSHLPPSTGGGIQDPCRGHDDHARRRLEVDNGARYPLLAALAPDTTPIEGVPAIVDLDFLPDMGRMTPRSRWAARTTSLPADAGGRRAAILYTLIQAATLNGLDPEACLRDVLARIADHPINQIDQLLPWHSVGAPTAV
jgi:hypothetical protein